MKNTRRQFIHTCIGLVSGGLVLNACGSSDTKETKEEAFVGDPCENMAGITGEEIAKRKQLGYVNKSPIPENRCDNCQLYIPPKSDKECGGCMLFKGPVYAEAYCTYWAPQL
jgi:hypothetical protein